MPAFLPHPRVIESYVSRLLELLEADPGRARELLARHMPPLVLTPEGRSYRMTGGFNLSVALDETAEDGAADGPESMIGRVGGTGIVPESCSKTSSRRSSISDGSPHSCEQSAIDHRSA